VEKKEEKKVDPEVAKKAQTLAVVFGGDEKKYYEMVENFNFLSIDELVQAIAAENENKNDTPTQG